MSNHPVISVVLCTFNNADSLAITLEQIFRQKIANNADVEVILIDNNSPDRTLAVFEKIKFLSPFPINYFFESRQGLSHARNTGVESASGRYILFTDDDADLPDDWISGYLQNIETFSPDCLYSKINIIWDKPIPWWYTNRYRPYFVGLDYGDSGFFVTDIHREFFGKNFCIKKELVVEFGGFDPALGRSGTKLIAGEETLLYRKLIQQKKIVYYFPESPVGHRLKEREYTEANIKKQFIDSSYSSYHIAKLTAEKKLFGRPLAVLSGGVKSILVSLMHMPVSKFMGNKQDVFFHAINIKKALTLFKLWILSK